jgi:hypothetical protein
LQEHKNHRLFQPGLKFKTAVAPVPKLDKQT